MIAPDSQAIACPLSGRNSTYHPVQIYGTGSISEEEALTKLLELNLSRTATEDQLSVCKIEEITE
jgi:hypothetical protein